MFRRSMLMLGLLVVLSGFALAQGGQLDCGIGTVPHQMNCYRSFPRCSTVINYYSLVTAVYGYWYQDVPQSCCGTNIDSWMIVVQSNCEVTELRNPEVQKVLADRSRSEHLLIANCDGAYRSYTPLPDLVTLNAKDTL